MPLLADPLLAAAALDAVAFAAAAHDGQRRKGTGDTYILHPVRVAKRVAELTIDDPDAHRQMIIAALLHDVLEDTHATPQQIERRFGAAVLQLVEHLTEDMSLPHGERVRCMFEHVGQLPREARLIKLVDRLDNVNEMDGLPREFISRYCRETRTLLGVLRGTCAGLEAEIAAILSRHEAP